MKAWYLEGGPPAAGAAAMEVESEHDADVCRASLRVLTEIGVLYWHLPLESKEVADDILQRIRTERGLVNHDVCEISATAMPATFASVCAENFREHSMDEEEVRLVLDGECCYDVRDSADLWIRVHLQKGDLVLLPANIHRRFSLGDGQCVRCMRLFRESPSTAPNFRFPTPNDCREVAPPYGPASITGEVDPREVIPMICANFYSLGWVSGTGGGMAVKLGNRYFMAPSGVQKEKITPEMIFVLDSAGTVLERPKHHPAQKPYKLSECAPLFMNAFEIRGAGAVLHNHSIHAVMATLLSDEREFRVTHLEMIKGLVGHCYHEPLVIPIVENTPRECQLADTMAAAIRAYPKASAVLVRRHGIYVWGKDWRHAKTQAECLDYLFEAAVKMRSMGIDHTLNPYNRRPPMESWYMDNDTSVDQRLEHRLTPNQPAPKSALEDIGVAQWQLDPDKFETDPELQQIRNTHGYSYHDIITVSPDKLPGYEQKIKTFYEEHLHTDDEIRYVLDGSGYFDVRDKNDRWIRIAMRKGDMITLPAGIYHRFTLDHHNYIRAMRLFVGDPVWTAHNRTNGADAFLERSTYLADVASGKAKLGPSAGAGGGGLLTNGGTNGTLNGAANGTTAKKRTYAEAAAAHGSASPPVKRASLGLYSDQSTNGPAAMAVEPKRLKPMSEYQAVLLDIEGTTTPISFVKEVLFPWAAKNVAAFLTSRWGTAQVAEDVALLQAQALEDGKAGLPGVVPIPSGPDVEPSQLRTAVVNNVLWQIQNNRKTKALKQLQGHIWKLGYDSGDLKAQLFEDVPAALVRWQKAGLRVFIYSSGSREAQRMIFRFSDKGDLRKHLSGYFDTNIGAKVEEASYHQIMETIGVDQPSDVLFCTDMLKEAEAASQAGLDVALMVRPGNGPLPHNHGFCTTHDFNAMV